MITPEQLALLLQKASIVANETETEANDANRIGTLFADIIRALGDGMTRTEVETLISEIGRLLFLSKNQADTAQGHITFNEGLTSNGDAIVHGELRSDDYNSGLFTGNGWHIDAHGNAELESLRVRSFLEVVELLINRMQAQEGDTLFTDNDQIDGVERQVDETDGSVSYILTLKEKWDGYRTAQMFGNILRGIVNTLAAQQAGVSDVQDAQTVETDGSNSYYTSWMHVTGTHNTDSTLGVNQIRVVLYGDTEVPAQRNFPPCKLMTIGRWGCIDYSDPTSADYEAVKASITRRQNLFFLSTSDGRITKLNGVDAPILHDWNYGTTLGELPDFVKRYPSVAERIAEGGDYLYAQGIVVGDFIKIDKEGRPLTNYVDRGEWAANTVYLVAEYNAQTGQYETHDVWHNGQKWRCLQHQPVTSGGVSTYYEPKWNSPYWLMIEGNDSLTLEFTSTRGYSFRRGNVNTQIEPHLFYGSTDITSDIALQYWSWTRHESDNETQGGTATFTPQDVTWNEQHVGVKNLPLTNSDMPFAWSFSNKAVFTCIATVNDGKATRIVQNQVIS